MTIISASYKTDIPAFYGEWFENRLAEGFVQVRNPFNNKLSTVSLEKEDITGFVFWTRNIAPFLPRLERLIAGHFPFYVQFTLTGYPTQYEASVPDRQKAALQIQELARQYGPKAVVWRYDTVLLSSEMPFDYHVQNFKKISDALSGFTNEVVVSFAQFYQKTRRNLKPLTDEKGIQFDDPDHDAKKVLLRKLGDIAGSNGQRMTLCTQPKLETPEITGAACICADRLDLTQPFKIHGNRAGCLCVTSKDIGGYDTCPHGCVYCYAVSSRRKAKNIYQTHHIAAPFLS